MKSSEHACDGYDLSNHETWRATQTDHGKITQPENIEFLSVFFRLHFLPTDTGARLTRVRYRGARGRRATLTVGQIM